MNNTLINNTLINNTLINNTLINNTLINNMLSIRTHHNDIIVKCPFTNITVILG